MASSGKVCQFFVSSSGQGCPYGAMCNFSHDLSSSQASTSRPIFANPEEQQDRRPQRPCQFYRRGFCKDGSRCKFRHDDYVPPVSQQNRPPVPENQPKPAPQRQGKGICRFFLSTGSCRSGDRCRFSHEVKRGQKVMLSVDNPDNSNSENPLPSTSKPSQNEVPTERTEKGQAPNSAPELNQNSDLPKRRTRPCRYFSSTNGCRLGENCQFLHEARNANESGAPLSKPAPRVVSRPAPMGAALESNLSEMSDAAQEKACDTEIEMLKKRYPQFEEVTREKGGMAYQVKFTPTDPDWPYDVKCLTLELYFPPLYPKKMLDINVPEQDQLPETVRRCVLFSVVDWVTARFKNFEKKGRVERVFRPFLRWLDRDLEDIFTDALTHYKREIIAKAAGIEIIPARHLKARYHLEDTENPVGDDCKPSDEHRENLDVDTQQQLARQLSESLQITENQLDNPEGSTEESTSGDKLPKISSYDPVAKGIEVKLKELQLGDSVATLVATSVKLMVRCARCKEPAEVGTPADRLNQLNCGKCNHLMHVKYRPAMTHGFSSILGFLDLEECAVFDMLLMDCEFVANCMSCNKDNKFGGIPPGQLKNTWCMFCHSKMSVAIEGVQFRQLQPTTIEKVEGAHKVETVKAIRNVKDPAVKEGFPLPDNGICKHYKKSFRWLRFPCCGKTYPCDICHDKKEDHEMKIANRMICGYCAREQPFAPDRPCVSCGSSMTKQFTEHWEGGKGCRDVIKMSRNDNKKYASRNKTISRKAQAAKGPNSKKTLKVRHT